jgi:hypothetical protein
MTPQKALERVEKLLALAGPNSGASEEESRSAAVAAARLIAQHGLSIGDRPPVSAIDLDEVTRLALRVMELEGLLADRRAAYAREIRENDRRWAQVVEDVRNEERSAAKKCLKTAGLSERVNLGRQGGHERAKSLSPERRREIGRAAVAARWKKWRELHAARG